jgi:hypothetical protein
MRSDCCEAVLISPTYVVGGAGIRIAVKLIESAALFGTAGLTARPTWSCAPFSMVRSHGLYDCAH